MRKLIIIPAILLLAVICVTVFYFKNLNPPGQRISQVMGTIPRNAALIFEFNNDRSFYDIFNGNKLFAGLVGKGKLAELDTLQRQLLLSPLLEKYFTGQNIFASLHPVEKNDLELLITIAAPRGSPVPTPDKLMEEANPAVTVKPYKSGTKPGFEIFVKSINKSFYLIINDDNVLSGSFSKELADQAAAYKLQLDKQSFVLLSDQQDANSLANLYINYSALTPLFNQLFKNKNSDIFESLRRMTAFASLGLNYRSDALMFNGQTNINAPKQANYIDLFATQNPVENHLKDMFPATTAFSTTFAVSDPVKFENDLTKWQTDNGLKDEKDKLFTKIRTETKTRFRAEFTDLLGNEFAVITTRYLERFAIISVKDGSKLKAMMANVCNMTDENSGVFSYDKVPYFLLGDPFSVFKHPFFMVIDNYLILANSSGELASFYDIYIHRKFMSKNEKFISFDNLLTERSNIAFLFNFRNSMPVLKRELYDEVYEKIENNTSDYLCFYAASVQFSASDNNFYSNFCLKLNPDSLSVKADSTAN
jgi:hypothetical protein